jgi:TIR domain-containing protein
VAGIFISYRREDSDVAAGRLADDLSEIFGPGAVFRDIDRLKPGEDYVKALKDVLASCVALVAVIGPRWLTITDDKGNRRLADPNDWVRAEIRTALDRGIPVIPILLSGRSCRESSPTN